jgi:hypothetical protein
VGVGVLTGSPPFVYPPTGVGPTVTVAIGVIDGIELNELPVGPGGVGVAVGLDPPNKLPLNILLNAPPVSGVGEGVTEPVGAGVFTATEAGFLPDTFQATKAATVRTAKTTKSAILRIRSPLFLAGTSLKL